MCSISRTWRWRQDPDAVAKRYSSFKPVLLPTVSDVPRTDYHLIKDYFVGFLKKK
jgi:hypothetical protein